ncbi:hypothetical protein AQ490_24310 [Wenjunlia vitaminophila]|uniref:Protein kinase domain-containing protein n=1 Tax=Wenjunlia vitaminophila TaxID=76728 RepID=A0A0T6LRP3_WENVI|nr:serine/threonine-protein kinase [Wenjunlia vitaminophila]KRV48660.1 hypothetical protein AQ490_24310 [Wenjunlia vitaminophila]
MKPLADSDPRQVGPYPLLAELGHGGMGRVYLGVSPDGRLVAVKLIREALRDDERHRGRFRREVATARRVPGLYTAPVIAADLDAPTPWLASAFIAGPSLQQVIENEADGEPLPEEAALRLADGLVTALAEIHQVGLVHRDLKPENILLTRGPTDLDILLSDQGGVFLNDAGVRVIDFGISLATDDALGSTRMTQTGWLVGSPAYMSPEQIEGDTITPASDIFSLGAVLVMACTGSSPFAGPSVQRVLHNVVYTEADLSGLPPRLGAIAAACLAKDPAQRPDLNQLRELIGRVSASARPWPHRVHRLTGEQRVELAGMLRPMGSGTTTGNPQEPNGINKRSWNSRTTDRTPFTADALLPAKFVNDLDIEYVRVAAGPRPCEEAGPDDLVSVLTACGCTEAMTGVYLEQGGPNPPVLVSVAVFPMPDYATAKSVYQLLIGEARWRMTIWSAQVGDDNTPRPGTFDSGFRWAHDAYRHRYVFSARAIRTDLLKDGWLKPWLRAAAKRAATSCGPQNHRSS